MKNYLISSLAAAFCALSLVASAKTPESERSVQLRVDLDRTVLPAGATEHEIVKIAFEGARGPRREQRTPVNLVLVLDRSGSMSGEKIEQAKAAAFEAVRRLSPDDVFSLVAFDNNVDTLIPACRVGDGRELEERIGSIRPGGGTAIYAGVNQGAAELRKHLEDRRYIHRMVLLSDGLANVGPSQPADFARLGAALIKEGISVSTIGLGLGYNEDLMTRLAQKSDGNTYFAESGYDLTRIFNSELGDVLSVVARRVVITIEFPEGVRPIRFVGREGTIHGQRAELSLNQIYGGQEKFALVEVEVAPASVGTEREIAHATLSYEDTQTQKLSTLRANAGVRFTANEREVVASANRQVQTDYAVNATAMAKDAAVSLVDSGRQTDAARVLQERNAELKKIADVYGNADVQKVVAKNAQEADRLKSQGLDNVARKSYRAENMQTINQQSSYSSP
jgi:Ca-activated chloride channel family protein